MHGKIIDNDRSVGKRLKPSFRAIFSMDFWMNRLSGRSSQILVLVQHFFNRLFQNEVIPFEEQMKEKLIICLVMLAILGGHIAVSLFGKYGMLAKYIFLTYDPGTWVDKCFFIAFFMSVLAFIVVLNWDIMLLDRTDAQNLLPLPIEDRTLFQAKFLSFGIFIFLFAAAVNVVAVAVVSFFLPHLRSNRFAFLFQYAAAHLLSTTAAFIFIFFFFALLNATLFLILSPRLYRRVILVIRFGLLVVLVFLIMTLLISSFIMPNMFDWLKHVRDNNTNSGVLFPPFWFTGLYEWLLGERDPMFEFGAYIAVTSLLVLPLMYFYAMAICYRRHLRASAEEFVQRDPLRGLKRLASRAFQTIALRNHTQSAVYYFTVRTLLTSARHQFQIAAYLSLGIGMSLIFLLRSGISLQLLSIQNVNALSVPFVLSFFLIIGLRTTVSQPLAAEANWIFKMTENESRRHYFVGMKKALIIRVIFPLFLLLFFPYTYAWGWKMAAIHIFFAFISSLILLEILFWKYSKIPFSCISMPGRAKVHFNWIFYIVGFLVYTRGLSSLEREILKSRGGYTLLIGSMAVIFIFFWIYENAFLYRRLRIVYEDEPEKILISLE